jgi:hypothetical protein
MLAEEVLELLRHPTGLLTSSAGPSCCVSPHMYLRYELLFVINHLSADFCRLRQRVVRAAAAASVLPGGAGVTSVPLPLEFSKCVEVELASATGSSFGCDALSPPCLVTCLSTRHTYAPQPSHTRTQPQRYPNATPNDTCTDPRPLPSRYRDEAPPTSRPTAASAKHDRTAGRRSANTKCLSSEELTYRPP